MKRSYLWPAVILCCVVVISLVLLGNTRLWGQAVAAQGLTGEISDAFIFQLLLGGQTVAEYTECSGLGSSNMVEETVIEMDKGAVTRKTPGALEWHNIVLKRVGPSDAQVASWRKALETGNLNEAVRDGAIVMRRLGTSEPVARWNFIHGWPATLTLDGSVEELTIVHEGLERTATTSTGTVPSKR